MLESQNKVGQIFGTVSTSGITSDAYCGELLGIYAILSAVSYIERYNHQFTTGILQVGCDNEKAGWISGLASPTPAVQSKHFDLVKAIRRLRLTLKTQITFYHTYGHQDQQTDIH